MKKQIKDMAINWEMYKPDAAKFAQQFWPTAHTYGDMVRIMPTALSADKCIYFLPAPQFDQFYKGCEKVVQKYTGADTELIYTLCNSAGDIASLAASARGDEHRNKKKQSKNFFKWIEQERERQRAHLLKLIETEADENEVNDRINAAAMQREERTEQKFL
jgi:hypothetical protein